MASPVRMLRNLAEAVHLLITQSLIGGGRRRLFRSRSAPAVHTTPNGVRFELYPGELLDGDIYAYGIYERRFLDLLKTRLKHGRSFLDVGANIGNHALYLCDIFEQVHCFDPNPAALKRLRRNIALNEATNIRVHPVGLGAANAQLPFIPDLSGNMARGSFVYEGQAEPVMLPVVDASEYIAEQGITGIDFIKVDVEGFEPHVFRGLRDIIAAHRPVVAFEYHGHIEPLETWREITSSMPGYVFADAVPPAPAGALAKVGFALRHGTHPPPARLEVPAYRSYGAILGFPSAESFRQFLG